MLRAALLLQGVFYVGTALWTFFHLQSFVAVVGPKPDVFQLHVTSALIIVIGSVLVFGSRRPNTSVALLGIASALAFVVLDIAYDRALRPIYWLDAIAEAAIAVLLFVSFRRERQSSFPR